MDSQKFDDELTVKFFAYCREIVGKETIKLKLKDKTTTVGDIRMMIFEMYPSLSSLSKVFFVAVNHKLANDDTILNDHDEVAILPPVSGGSC
jgi:molybdopterin converting factor subunit 1